MPVQLFLSRSRGRRLAAARYPPLVSTQQRYLPKVPLGLLGLETRQHQPTNHCDKTENAGHRGRERTQNSEIGLWSTHLRTWPSGS